jgi:hypothetical protein
MFSPFHKEGMAIIDPEVAQKMQPELMTGETLLWTGRPNPSVIFHSSDLLLIPFSLLWGGFAIFWEAGVLGFFNGNGKSGHAPLFMALWGIPFVVIGQYMIWGRFVYDAWLKRRTYYAVTNRRVIVAQDATKWKTSWAYIANIPTVQREGTDRGTLWFGPKAPVVARGGQRSRSMSQFSVGDVPVFADIDDVDSVYRLVMDLREKADSKDAGGKEVFRNA